jgi:hypothetical protein
VQNLADDWIDEPVNVACADPIAITIDGYETTPRTVVTVFEDDSGRATIQNRIGAAPKEQPFEPTRCRAESGRAAHLSEIREGGRHDHRQNQDHQNNLDQ